MEFGDDEGMNVTLEGATEILKFLAKMANITVRKFLSENKKIYNHGGIPNYAIAKNTYKQNVKWLSRKNILQKISILYHSFSNVSSLMKTTEKPLACSILS